MYNRSNPWASDWLKRYDKEDLEGLRNKTKSGRPSEISEDVVYQIKKELKESNNQGWTTKQVEELIIKKCGIKYHYTHTYTVASFVNGALNKRLPRKVHVNTASLEEKETFKKRSPKYLWMCNSSNSSRKKDLP